MVLEVAGKWWIVPFVKMFDLLGYRCERTGKCDGMKKTLKKGVGSLFEEAYLYRSKAISLKTKCETMVGHVTSTMWPRGAV